MGIRHASGVAIAALFFAGTAGAEPEGYEVWASDQSNSVSGAGGSGTEGSFLWIWDSADIEAQLAGGPDALPLSCERFDGGATFRNVGPCDLLDVFPQDLVVPATGTRTLRDYFHEVLKETDASESSE